MAKPAKKIWCPKCHKRHSLPPNAGGLTLRCRGCRFAFRIQDGLTFDPRLVNDPAVDSAIDHSLSTPAHYASTEVIPLSESSAGEGDLPVAKPVPMPGSSASVAESGEIVATIDEEVKEPDVDFDHDYDDILDVLDKPASDPVAPARACAKTGGALTTVRSVDPNPTRSEPEQVRRPVTRQQLRAHKNARQFWMLMSFLFACLLGGACWFGTRFLIQPELSPWERKILFAMGAPARLLPPQPEGEELILPANHVKLRGDHFELANRNDFFRDEFPEENFFNGPDNEDGDKPEAGFAVRRDGDVGRAERAREAPVPRAENRQPGGNRFPNRDAARIVPRNNAPRANGPPGRNNVARNGGNAAPQQNKRFQAQQAPTVMTGQRAPNVARAPIGRLNPRDTRNSAVRNRANPRIANRAKAWTAPKLMPGDLARVTSNGIDPKVRKSLSIDMVEPARVVLTSQAVFSIGRDRKFAAWDLGQGVLVDDQKLDRDVAAMSAGLKNEISGRPEAWLLYGNGKLEKWELRGGRLRKLSSVSVRAVFKEKMPLVAAGKNLVAYRIEDQVVIVRVMEASSKIGETKPVVIGGNVRALQFSEDESKLLVLADNKVLLVDTDQARVLSETSLPGDVFQNVKSGSQSVNISSDLSTMFVCRNGVIDSFSIRDGSASGRYWSTAPLPLNGVATYGDELLGFAGNGSSHATLFSIEQMEPAVSASAPVANANKPERKRERKDVLRGDQAIAANGRYPHEVDRSPPLAAAIQSIISLPGKRIAFLTVEREGDRICIATLKDRWTVTSLKIDAGTKVKGFDISDDASKVALHSTDVIQAWNVVDPDSGEAEFVSESVVHTEKITRINLTNDGKRIVSGDWSGNVFVSSFDNGRRIGSVEGFRTSIRNIAPRGDSGFAVMDQRGVAKNRGNISPFGTVVNGASAMSGNGSKIACYVGFEVRVADDDGKKILGVVKPKDRPDFIAFSNDQKHLLLQNGREISVWDWRKGERIRVFRYSKSVKPALVPLAVSADDKTVAVVTGDRRNQISIFEMPDTDAK